jgi:hypothetical protein
VFWPGKPQRPIKLARQRRLRPSHLTEGQRFPILRGSKGSGRVRGDRGSQKKMLGLFRVIENDKTLVIELFSLFETPDGVALRFRHFTPALVPWEQSGLTTMKLAEFGAKGAVFENSAGGQPKRAAFSRIDPDTYISKSEIMPADGSAHSTEITYHRQK